MALAEVVCMCMCVCTCACAVKCVINTRLRVSIVMLRNVYGSVWRLVDDKSVVTARSRALAPSPPESDRRAGGSDE